MDPNADIQLGLTLLNIILNEINRIKAERGLTGDQLADLADKQDLANADAIKALLAG